MIRRVSVRRCANFHADWSSRCWDMAISLFLFLIQRPSAILDLLYACYYHPRRARAGLCHCAKFDWMFCSSFNNMQVLTFCALGLKCLFTPPKSGFWGVLHPIWAAVSTRPQNVLSRPMTYGCLKSVYVRDKQRFFMLFIAPENPQNCLFLLGIWTASNIILSWLSSGTFTWREMKNWPICSFSLVHKAISFRGLCPLRV